MASSVSAQWIYDSPVHSDAEAKLRELLLEMGNDGKILGIQVCAYKDGKVVIDTAAGVLDEQDPRPVQPDSLFSVFSVTKGITSGMLHWVVDKGKVKFEDNVANIWPEFGTNKKDLIKVHHVLNHTSGLHNAMANLSGENSAMMCDWDACLHLIAASEPECEPCQEQLYHYKSFGWLCGGIIEHASGKKFQEVLEEAFVRPLNIEGEMYIGIPPGVESRLASLTLDTDDLKKLSGMNIPELPSTFKPQVIAQTIGNIPVIFNNLNIRRAIIPAANGHCSARALARYYAALVDGGVIPPPLGGAKKEEGSSKIFSNPKIHDAFMGVGEYESFAFPNGTFGLGFRRVYSSDGSLVGFGHSGMGGSTGFCDIKNRFAISVTLNKLSFGTVTGNIVRLVCSELDIPTCEDFSVSGHKGPIIN